jgi:hypothetical protein
MKYITPLLFALLIIPAAAWGGSVWSQQSVTTTYEQRLEAIEQRLVAIEAEKLVVIGDKPAIGCPEFCRLTAEEYGQLMQLEEEVAELYDEKRILDVAYWLINESFE